MNTLQWEKNISQQIPALLRYAKALTHNSHYAEDLLQDCLERAWSRRQLFDQNKDLRVWLFTIMHNLYVNHVSKLENRKIKVSIDSVELTANIESNIALRDFEIAVQKLKSEYREILILVAVENLSYVEVSEILDIPIGTVTSRLYRARENLRLIMQDKISDKIVKLK